MPSDPVPQNPVLRVDDLTIRFRGLQTDTIDGVSFAIPPGKTLCLVGESGCGKSVTSLAMMGLLPKGAATNTRGSVRFNGVEMLGLGAGALADLRGNRMVMIFQEPMTSLNPVFTVGDQITEAILRHRGGTAAAARARAGKAAGRIPAPIVRRHAPARDDRNGAGQ